MYIYICYGCEQAVNDLCLCLQTIIGKHSYGNDWDRLLPPDEVDNEEQGRWTKFLLFIT